MHKNAPPSTLLDVFSFPNEANMGQVGLKLASDGPKLAQVGPKLGSSWPLEAMLPSSFRFGPSGGRLGDNLAGLGAVLEPFGGRLGLQEGVNSAWLSPA